MNSKVGNFARRRPDFEPASAAPKQLNLKSLAMQAGSKVAAGRRSKKPTFDFICVYLLFVFAFLSASLCAETPPTPVFTQNEELEETVLEEETPNYYVPCDSAPRIHHFYADYVFGRGLGFNTGYTTLGFFTAPGFIGGFLPFLDFRGHVFNDGKWAANGGGGVRYLFQNVPLFLGMNAFYDYRRYKSTNFSEIGVGLELLSDWVALRANGYLPYGRNERKIGYFFSRFEGFNLLIEKQSYLSMWGVDGEIEARLFNYKGAEFQVSAGPYYYRTNKSFDEGMVGGRANASLHFRKIVYASATTTFDRIFHWRWQGEVGINLPFGPRAKKQSQVLPALCSHDAALFRRAYRPVDRQEIIVISKQKKTSTAINPATGQPYIFFHVNNAFGTSGPGSFAAPFSNLSAAQTISKSGDTILVNYGNGSSLGMSSGITLKSNQRLIGTSIAFDVSTTKGTIVVPALTPNSYPVLTNLVGNIVTLANNTEVAGLMLTSGVNGIFGSNLSMAPYIHDNKIFNVGLAAGAIDASIRLTWTAPTNVMNTLRLSNNLITLAQGAVAAQNMGVYIDFTSATGSTLLNISFEGNQVLSNNVDGIRFEKAAAGDCLLTGSIVGNNISGNTNSGIRFLHLAGAFPMTMGLSISSNEIVGNATAAANAGIISEGAAAAVDFTQGTLIIENNLIANSAGFAVDIQMTGTNSLGSKVNNNTFVNTTGGVRYLTQAAGVFLDLEMRNNTAVSTGYVLTRTLGIFQAHLSNNTGPLAITGGVTLLP